MNKGNKQEPCGENRVLRILKNKGYSVSTYPLYFGRPSQATLQKYAVCSQSPITSTGCWLPSPRALADNLGVPLECLFPGDAEKRVAILEKLKLRSRKIEDTEKDDVPDE